MTQSTRSVVVDIDPTAARKQTFYAHPELPSQTVVPEGWRVVSDVHDADVIVAFREVEKLPISVQRAGLFLVPVVALDGVAPDWCDFCADPEVEDALRRGLAKAQGILRRLTTISLPPEPTPSDLLLARLYSREVELIARYAPATPDMVAYPAAGAIQNVSEVANALVNQGFLSASFFDRLYRCSQCRSSRLIVREECTACRSSNLTEESLLHHFRCGHEALESKFKQNGTIICPKCSRELRHIGLDYDRPGTAVVCGECAAINDASVVGFVCTDCSHHHSAEEVPHRDWFHYRLSPAGLQLIRSGKGVNEIAGPGRDRLRVLVQHARAEQEDFNRPFQLVRFQFAAADQIRRRSPRVMDQSGSLAYDAAVSAVRRIDAVEAIPDGLLVFLAGLNAREAKKAIAAVETRIAGVVAEPLEPVATILSSQEIDGWLRGERL